MADWVDRYNTTEQIEVYRRRKVEVARIQNTLNGIPGTNKAIACFIQFQDELKYILFLLEALQKLQEERGKP